MTKTASLPLALTALLLLTACGGGGGGGGGAGPIAPPPPGPVDEGPASNSVEDLAAYAATGAETRMSYRTNPNPWRKNTRCGGGLCVSLERLPELDTVGLVARRPGLDGPVDYALVGREFRADSLPSGRYNGVMTGAYRVDGGAWTEETGDMSFGLDMETASLTFGGGLRYRTTDGRNTLIQFFGSADVIDGAFTDATTRILLDSGGIDLIVSDVGVTEGILATDGTTDAILGTVALDDQGLELRSGFFTTRDPRF